MKSRLLAYVSVLCVLMSACTPEAPVPEPPVAEGAPDPQQIVRMAHAAAGGESWKRPRTLHLTGTARLYPDGTRVSGVEATHYEMWRVFPAWNRAAHGANGKFRLDALGADTTIFQISYDGEHTWNERGKVEQAAASREWSENFGFGIIRFALDDGFQLTRMADDLVDGYPVWTVRVGDPAGEHTLFWIDQTHHAIRKVGFATPRGWHERIYSDFYLLETPRFQQPGRVRLYYNGALVGDIQWTHAEVDGPIADDTFVLNQP